MVSERTIWLTGKSLVKGEKIAPEVILILDRLNLTAEVKNHSEGLICLIGPEEIMLGLADIAKSSVAASFWLVGGHLLNGGQSPNKNIKALLTQLGVEDYSVINTGMQDPMVKFSSDDEFLIKGINLLAKSKFVC